MAAPYFKYSSTYIYFDNGMIVPYQVTPDRPQAVGRAEDGTLKVYDHSLAGSYKRTWKLKARMDNGAASNHKFSDFISFMETTIVHAKYQFSYYDKDGNSYTVRALQYLYRTIRSGLWEITVTIEEDYA